MSTRKRPDVPPPRKLDLDEIQRCVDALNKRINRVETDLLATSNEMATPQDVERLATQLQGIMQTPPSGGGGSSGGGAHHDLTGWDDFDDHTALVMLAGRNYAAGPFGSMGQTIYGSSIDGPLELLAIEANSGASGVVGGGSHAYGAMFFGIGVTSIAGTYFPIIMSHSCDLDASVDRVQIGAIIASNLFGQMTLIDDTNDLVYAGYGWNPNLVLAGDFSITGGTSFEANPKITAASTKNCQVEHIVGLRIEPQLASSGGGSIINASQTGITDQAIINGAGSVVSSRIGHLFGSPTGTGGTQDCAAAQVIAVQVATSAAWSMFAVEESCVFASRGAGRFGAANGGQSTLASTANVGDTILTLVDSTGFASAGVIFIFDRFFSYTANNTGTGELTLAYALQGELLSGLVVVQVNSPVARLDVYTDSDSIIGQIIQGFAGQTANLSEWQDDAAAVLAFVDPAGKIESVDKFAVNGMDGISGTATFNGLVSGDALSITVVGGIVTDLQVVP